MDPCAKRVANGMQCAREFGIAFAREHGRSPHSNEIDRHLETEKFTPQHRGNLLSACWNAARETLAKHPAVIRALAAEKELETLKETLRNLVGKRSKHYQTINNLVNATIEEGPVPS